MTEAGGADLVFVLGVAPRSGTNFLWRLLLNHRGVAAPRPLLEDYLFARLDLLDRYVAETAEHWDADWGDLNTARERLFRGLGDGLAGTLRDLAGDGRPIAKTPNVTNLPRVRRFLPHAAIVLITREGRSVAESAVRAFGMPYERAFRMWRHGAREILRFSAGETGPGPHVLVRYEDLVRDTRPVLEGVLDAVGLDRAGMDWQATADLPVFGSSFERGGAGDVHWRPVAVGDEFDPTDRTAAWPPHRHARFAWVAGTESARLGYEVAQPGPAVVERGRDVVWRLRQLAGGG